MKTYQEVADKILKTDNMKARYIYYMTTRWAKTEALKCETGYAEEWAYRFLAGRELGCSDREGQAILVSIGPGE